MLLAGDELGHTHKGNNNTYCQDNELSRINWKLNEEEAAFLEFVKKMFALWRSQPVLQRRKFFQGRSIRGAEVKDITWFEPSGKEMTDEAWGNLSHCFGVRWGGELLDVNEHGERIVGDTLLLLINAHHEKRAFILPLHGDNEQWELAADTANPASGPAWLKSGQEFSLQDRSLAVFILRKPASEVPTPGVDPGGAVSIPGSRVGPLKG